VHGSRRGSGRRSGRGSGFTFHSTLLLLPYRLILSFFALSQLPTGTLLEQIDGAMSKLLLCKAP